MPDEVDDNRNQGVLRVLDANANRVREGLRVAEDYCRFVLEDAALSRRLKQLRHAVTTALIEADRESELTDARDADNDPGKDWPETRTGSRLEDVVTANVKRAQEGLRVLEEFAKASSVPGSATFKQLRFDLYTLEKDLNERMDGPAQN